MPPMWNMGSGVRLTVSASKPHSGEESTAAERLRCVVSTPLGTPVVPDVYICSTVSSGCSPTARVIRQDATASQRSYSAPIATTRRSCATAPASSPATAAYARPREQQRRAGVLQDGGELGRAQPPVQAAPPPPRSWRPRTAAPRPRGRCDRGGRRATPGPTPAASRACARRLERSSSSAKVSERDAVLDRDAAAALAGLMAQHVRDPELLSQHEVNSSTRRRRQRPRRSAQACPRGRRRSPRRPGAPRSRRGGPTPRGSAAGCPGGSRAIMRALATGMIRSCAPWTTIVGTPMRRSRPWQLCIAAA